MRTVHCIGWGVFARGCLLGGCLSSGVCLLGVSVQGGCLPGSVWPWRFLPRGCLPQCMLVYTPPCEQNHRRLLKHNLAATTLRTVTIIRVYLRTISNLFIVCSNGEQPKICHQSCLLEDCDLQESAQDAWKFGYPVCQADPCNDCEVTFLRKKFRHPEGTEFTCDKSMIFLFTYDNS